MVDLVSGFPKNLAYSLKSLQSFTKQSIKVLPDRTNVAMNETSRFRLPNNALLDLRTLSIFADATCSNGGATDYKLKLPRLTSSLIQQLTITINGVQVCNINDYNLLYNTLYDLEGADISQNSKRILENPDPSITFSKNLAVAVETGITASKGCLTTTINDSRPICINNFLGFLGSASTPVIDTSDLGEVVIEIRWAPVGVCFKADGGGADAVSTATASWSLSNLRMTISKVSFGSSDYYELKASKLLNDGLLIGYYDYFTARGSAIVKASGVNMSFPVNTNSLDQCIATFQHQDYNNVNSLVLYNASDNTASNVINFSQYLANPVGQTNGDATIGDGFNQSYYFKRGATDITSAKWTINSVSMNPYPLPPEEIYNETLIAMGNNNIDMGASGIHPGNLSLYHFCKYYFTHILSLENISGDAQFWRSGLDGKQASITIQYEASFSSANTGLIQPVIFCRSTKVLTINAGRLISVV